MQAPSDEIETLTQETAIPTAPALDPERITLEVELVSPSNPPNNTKKHKYAPSKNRRLRSQRKRNLCQERSHGISAKRGSASWRLRGTICGIIESSSLCTGPCLSRCVLWPFPLLPGSARVERLRSRWKKIMETTGFVDWPQLKESSGPEICATIIIGAFIVSLVLVPTSLLNQSRRGLRLASYLAMLASITSFVSLSRQQISNNGETVESMMKQAVPVANFNRGFCYAWCRKSEAGLIALARGECGPNERTVFDEISALFDVKNWCTQAIAHQNYDLLANYSGIPPFAGLKGAAGRNLTDMSAKKDHGLTALLSVMQLWIGPLPLFLDLIPYGWR